MLALRLRLRDFENETEVEENVLGNWDDLPDVVAPHGREHQEVRDEHEGNGEEDDFD